MDTTGKMEITTMGMMMMIAGVVAGHLTFPPDEPYVMKSLPKLVTRKSLCRPGLQFVWRVPHPHRNGVLHTTGPSKVLSIAEEVNAVKDRPLVCPPIRMKHTNTAMV